MALVWRVTHKCNLNCWFCRAACFEASAPEVTECIIKRVLKEYVMSQEIDPDLKAIYFTGGEPFVRADFLRIVRYVHDNFGVFTSVATNGTKITARIAKHLAKYSVNLMVGLDGYEEVHNHMRGSNCFDSTIRALRLLIDAGCDVNVAITVSKLNLNSLKSDRMMSLLNDDLNGIKKIAIGTVLPMGRAKKRTTEIVDETCVVKLVKQYKGHLSDCDVLQRIPSLPTVRIDPQGFVFPCAAMESSLVYSDGNVSDLSLRDILVFPSLHHLVHSAGIRHFPMLWLTLQLLHKHSKCNGKTLALRMNQKLGKCNIVD